MTYLISTIYRYTLVIEKLHYKPTYIPPWNNYIHGFDRYSEEYLYSYWYSKVIVNKAYSYF